MAGGQHSYPVPEEPAYREPTLLYVIKQIELATRARLDEIFRPLGMTALQYTALTVLEHHPELTAVQLARHSFVTPQAMADMVAALLDRGLVVRYQDPDDRRRLLIALSADGQALLERYRGEVARVEEEMLSRLTTGEARQLRRSLLLCRAALNSGADPRSR